jgi:hypothetical protein
MKVTWTTERPSEPGLFWACFAGSYVAAVKITRFAGALYMSTLGSEALPGLSDDVTHWAKLEVPEGPNG